MARAKAKNKKLLWITDPWETLDHPKESTLRLMEEALLLEKNNFWCDVKTISLVNGRVSLRAKHLGGVKAGRAKFGFQFAEEREYSVGEFQVVFYRPDPPVDEAYLEPLQMLVFGARGKRVEFINSPEILFSTNEKLEGSVFPKNVPATLISAERAKLEAFGRCFSKTVLKPLNQAQGKGVVLQDWSEPENCLNAIRDLTGDFKHWVEMQQFLPGISDGEVRVWFSDGKVIGTVKRYPLADDFRVQIDRGSRVVGWKLVGAQKRLAEKIGLHLRKRKIRWAAVDFIGDKITDFNFTSPGLLVQMEEILGVNLSRILMKRI